MSTLEDSYVGGQKKSSLDSVFHRETEVVGKNGVGGGLCVPRGLMDAKLSFDDGGQKTYCYNIPKKVFDGLFPSGDCIEESVVCAQMVSRKIIKNLLAEDYCLGCPVVGYADGVAVLYAVMTEVPALDGTMLYSMDCRVAAKPLLAHERIRRRCSGEFEKGSFIGCFFYGDEGPVLETVLFLEMRSCFGHFVRPAMGVTRRELAVAAREVMRTHCEDRLGVLARMDFPRLKPPKVEQPHKSNVRAEKEEKVHRDVVAESAGRRDGALLGPVRELSVYVDLEAEKRRRRHARVRRIVSVQSCARRWIERLRLHRAKSAAIAIQATFRARLFHSRRVNGAVRVQAWVRRWTAHGEAVGRRRSASVIQNAGRLFLSKVRRGLRSIGHGLYQSQGFVDCESVSLYGFPEPVLAFESEMRVICGLLSSNVYDSVTCSAMICRRIVRNFLAHDYGGETVVVTLLGQPIVSASMSQVSPTVVGGSDLRLLMRIHVAPKGGMEDDSHWIGRNLPGEGLVYGVVGHRCVAMEVVMPFALTAAFEGHPIPKARCADELRGALYAGVWRDLAVYDMSDLPHGGFDQRERGVLRHVTERLLDANEPRRGASHLEVWELLGYCVYCNRPPFRPPDPLAANRRVPCVRPKIPWDAIRGRLELGLPRILCPVKMLLPWEQTRGPLPSGLAGQAMSEPRRGDSGRVRVVTPPSPGRLISDDLSTPTTSWHPSATGVSDYLTLRQ